VDTLDEESERVCMEAFCWPATTPTPKPINLFARLALASQMKTSKSTQPSSKTTSFQFFFVFFFFSLFFPIFADFKILSLRCEGPRGYYDVVNAPNITPDVWFEPVAVWEILTADLSISPVHKAAVGLVESNKGIALRFPRFVRVRDDKKPEQATTAQQVTELYLRQKNRVNQPTTNEFEDDGDF
jgi:hypothetical protein